MISRCPACVQCIEQGKPSLILIARFNAVAPKNAVRQLFRNGKGFRQDDTMLLSAICTALISSIVGETLCIPTACVLRSCHNQTSPRKAVELMLSS